jgi:hypothetical protein
LIFPVLSAKAKYFPSGEKATLLLETLFISFILEKSYKLQIKIVLSSPAVAKNPFSIERERELTGPL